MVGLLRNPDDEFVKRNYKFKFLVTSKGKISLWQANLKEVSQHAENSVDETVSLFHELINSY